MHGRSPPRATAAPLCEGAPTAASASSESTCPGGRLRTWPSPTARAATYPRRSKEPLTTAPPSKGARCRETRPRPAANTPDARSSPMRFLRDCVICVLVFFVGPTLKMSRAPQRHDRTDGQARRLHFAVGPAVHMSRVKAERPSVRRRVNNPLSGAERPRWRNPTRRPLELASRSPRPCRVTPFVDGARTTASRRRHGVLTHPSCGAGTPPPAATRFGDVARRAETSPMIRTTRPG